MCCRFACLCRGRCPRCRFRYMRVRCSGNARSLVQRGGLEAAAYVDENIGRHEVTSGCALVRYLGREWPRRCCRFCHNSATGYLTVLMHWRVTKRKWRTQDFMLLATYHMHTKCEMYE